MTTAVTTTAATTASASPRVTLVHNGSAMSCNWAKNGRVQTDAQSKQCVDSTLNSAEIAKGHVVYELDAPMQAMQVCVGATQVVQSGDAQQCTQVENQSSCVSANSQVIVEVHLQSQVNQNPTDSQGQSKGSEEKTVHVCQPHNDAAQKHNIKTEAALINTTVGSPYPEQVVHPQADEVDCQVL